ncbi:MAG TPA: LLM class F420-dependent oxidoreductase [Acidimicrobiia bacterium]
MEAARGAPLNDLGVVAPYWVERPPLETLEIVRNADRLGYSEAWIGELRSFDAFALAGAAARETDRIRLTVGPLAVGVRSPAALAMGVASVAVLGGRAAGLALGASNRTVVSGWHRRDWEGITGRMEETVSALRALADERRGPDGFRLGLPLDLASISVAGFGEKMTALAARLADRLVLNLVTSEQVGRQRRRLAEAAPNPPPIALWVIAAVEPGEATLAQIRRHLVPYLAAAGYRDMFRDAGFGDLVSRALDGMPSRELSTLVPTEMVEAVGAIGSLADVRRRLDEYRAAGVDYLAIVPPTAEDPGAGTLLARLRS